MKRQEIIEEMVLAGYESVRRTSQFVMPKWDELSKFEQASRRTEMAAALTWLESQGLVQADD